MTRAWPDTILKPAKITRHLQARTTAGTVSASGFTQRVAVPASAWVITYEGIVVATATQLLWWDLLPAESDGGANPILVPLIGEWQVAGVTAGTIAAASAGATTVVITRVGAGVLAGYHFSVGERLYRVIEQTSVASNDYTVKIRPPLREAVTGGAAVQFEKPVCRCRLASDDEMMAAIDPARLLIGNVKFLEDPTAP